jgi:hypothetical protein
VLGSDTLTTHPKLSCMSCVPLLFFHMYAQAGVLLVAAPALLAMQPHTLQHKLQHLQCLAQTHPSWLEAYRSCPSKSLAVLLTYSLERQLRLHYAAAHHLQHT